MNSKLKKAWNIFTTVVVILVVLCAVFLMGTRLLGMQVFNVLTGSMSPIYNPGDLIYVKSVDPLDVKVGDPITFVLNENLVVATHRVVDIDVENQYFRTKGDANDNPDAAPVHFNNLIGVPKFSLPKLGYVSDFVQNPPGTYITIAIVAVLVILVFLPDILMKKKEEVQPVAEQSTEEKSEDDSEDKPKETTDGE